MNDPTDNPPPRRLLLATDMTARCDRPLDRAKQLALEWRADLTVLVVQEGPSTPEEVSAWLDGGNTGHAFAPAARAELAEEFAGTGLVPALQVLDGDVTDAILDAAATFTDALVVIGASTHAPVQEIILGSTAARLAQELAHPLLVVRQRARGSYGRILVANDFSAASRRALDTAIRLFPGRPVTLLHVLEEGADAAPVMPADAMREVQEKSERFLERCPLALAERARIRIAAGHGLVTEALTRHVVEEGIGLVVLGVHRQSAVARVFIGSKSEDLMQQLPCDVLLVRALDGREDGGDDG
ncbi:universal stress protein [Pseudoduganella albidiflava]|uniref:Universal stress protein n=1 Tax=Pseudoduganella albidiflava TaxID=321983 RepID=A0A411X164_9BURK|nr:universal stress protein [Pseudoduganella albidiflava]QBI02592.1 universal stress protein [Pseudoduganella albidiflava]GGY41520.1 universal stress protein [Pseudoduganella albidiflava]